MPKATLKRGRRFVFTDWIVTEKRKEELLNLKDHRFIEFQKERCPETGRLHFQGYVCFLKPKRKTQLDKLFKKYWAMNMKGNMKQNEIYCTKGRTRVEGPWSHGDKPLDIERSIKGEKLIELCKEGATDLEIFETMPLLYARVNIQKCKELYRTHRDPNVEPEILIFWGESGTGKTRLARERYPDAFYAKLNDRMFPMDGYDGQEVIIFDEFRCQLRYSDLLQIVDRGICNVNVKYGSVKMAATKFIFTSNLDPKEWYKTRFDIDALVRRIKEWGKIYEFKKDVTLVYNFD